MRLAVPVALLLATACELHSPTDPGSSSAPPPPPPAAPPPAQPPAPPSAPNTPTVRPVVIPADAVPWTPPPVDSGGGAARCDAGEPIRPPERGPACGASPGALAIPTRIPFDHPTIDCGSPVVNAGGTLLVHASVGYCCGYSSEDAVVFQPDLTYDWAMLTYAPIAFGLGPDAFLVAGGEPGAVARIFARPVVRPDGRADVFGGSIRVPFPLDFFLPHRPWGYTGPFDAWPDGDGGLLIAATGAELDRTVALGLARLDATGALVAGPIRVASTGLPLEAGAFLKPLAAAVDGSGRILVVWEDTARWSCRGSSVTPVLSYAARWFGADGAPRGDPFAVELDDEPRAMLRLGDGSLALVTSRGWLAVRFAEGKRGTGPVPAPFALRDGRRLFPIPGGFASVEPPCTHPDRRARIEVLASSGESCGTIELPPLVTCRNTSEDDVVAGPDGTIAQREPPYDLQGCAYRLWPGALRAP